MHLVSVSDTGPQFLSAAGERRSKAERRMTNSTDVTTPGFVGQHRRRFVGSSLVLGDFNQPVLDVDRSLVHQHFSAFLQRFCAPKWSTEPIG